MSYLQTQENLFFHKHITGDGSPSFYTTRNLSDSAELMHSREGAFEETLYIYNKAVSLCFENKWPLSFISVGLGLGYNELCIVANSIKYNTEVQNLHSFELYEDLSNNFQAWAIGKAAHPFFVESYNLILDFFAEYFEIEKSKILKKSKNLIESGKWIFYGPLSEETNFETKYSCILFDAYSQNTSPELWSEVFLNKIISNTLSQSVLSTYAATSLLKKILKLNGFELLKRKGFAYKRESTFAIKS